MHVEKIDDVWCIVDGTEITTFKTREQAYRKYRMITNARTGTPIKSEEKKSLKEKMQSMIKPKQIKEKKENKEIETKESNVIED